MSTTEGRTSYHHGDLRNACLTAALALLEEDDEATLSLRGVARRAGVSATAPYRHFPDKDSLLAALATHGYEELRRRLVVADAAAPDGDEFVAMAQAYVLYALEHPALFRLMFGHPCHQSHPETTAAAHEASAVLAARVTQTVAPERQEAFLIGCWSLVHGLGTLVGDGKLDNDDPARVAELVRSVVVAMLGSSLQPDR